MKASLRYGSIVSFSSKANTTKPTDYQIDNILVAFTDNDPVFN